MPLPTWLHVTDEWTLTENYAAGSAYLIPPEQNKRVGLRLIGEFMSTEAFKQLWLPSPKPADAQMVHELASPAVRRVPSFETPPKPLPPPVRPQGGAVAVAEGVAPAAAAKPKAPAPKPVAPVNLATAR